MNELFLTCGLVACRLAPLVWGSSLWFAHQTPWVVRVAVWLGSAVLFAPFVGSVSANGLEIVLLAVKELAVGGALTFLVAQVFWGVRLAGGVLDRVQGVEARVADLMDGERRNAAMTLLRLLAVALFLFGDGHLLLTRVLFRSFEVVPIGLETGFWAKRVGEGALELALRGGEIFVLALALALPFVAVLWVAGLSMAAVERAAPFFQGKWVEGALRPSLVVLVFLLSLRALVDALEKGLEGALWRWIEVLGGTP